MDEPTLSRAERRQALDGLLLDSLRLVAFWLGWIYLLFAALDLVISDGARLWFQFGLTVATGCILLVTAYALDRWRPPAAWAHPLAMLISAAVLFRVLTHMWTSPPGYSTSNISLCILSAGCFLLSNRWLAALVLALLGSWVWVALRGDFLPANSGHLYPLLGASVVSFLVLNVRISSYTRFHELREADGRLRKQLADTLEVLKSREEGVRKMADTAPVIIGTLDRKAKCTFVNQGWLDFVGGTADEQLGYAWFKAVHPDDGRRWLRHYRRTMRMGKEFEVELRIRRPDGNYRWVAGHARPWQSLNSQSDGFIVSAIDIDDRKRAESRLQESETRMQQILDNTTSVVFVKDLEGRYLLINHQYEELFHVSRNEVQGMDDYDLFPREVAEHVRANDRQVALTGQLVEVEETVPHDGVPHTYIAVKFPLKDANGKTYAVCGIATDITARKTAEEALRHSEARFRRLFEANIIGVAFTDNDGNVTGANDAFLDMTGYARADLPVGWRAFSALDAVNGEAAVEHLLRDGFVEPRERELLRKDGQAVPVMIGAALLDRAKYECVAFVVDLTERKQADEQIRQLNVELQHASRLSMMGEMTAGLAHEVHQPLSVITNYATGCSLRLKRDGLDKDELLDCMQKISAEAVRAGTILKRIRGFIQKREMQRRPADLNAIVKEALQLARLDSRRQRVDIHFEPADIPQVVIDGIQLTQVILNLVLNGIEAMADWTGRRELTVTLRRRGEDSVEVVVSDTGPGVPPEFRDSVFEQFFTTKPEGLGMGLSISRSIVEAHNGRMWVTSNDDGGCAFHFILALPQPIAAQSPSEDSLRAT